MLLLYRVATKQLLSKGATFQQLLTSESQVLLMSLQARELASLCDNIAD